MKLVDIWGTKNETKNKPPTECLHFTRRQLQLLTSKNSPRNSGTLLMGCVNASGAPDSSRRHPGATHEVFSWTRSCEPVAHKSLKSRTNISIHAQELNTMSTSSMKKRLLPQVCCFTRRMMQLSSAHTRKVCRPTYFIPVRGSELLSPKRAKKGGKTLDWTLVYLHQFSRDFEIRVSAVNPLLYFQVVCTCCRNAYARRVCLTFS